MVFWMVVTVVWNPPTARPLAQHPEEPTPELQNGPAHKSIRISRQTILGVLALALVTVNFLGSIVWLMQRENDFYHAKTEQLIRVADSEDLIVIGRAWILKEYLEHCTDTEVVAVTTVYSRTENKQEAIDNISRLIDQRLEQGRTVFVSSEAVELEEDAIRPFGPDIVGVNEQLWDRYRSRWQSFGDDVGGYFRLRAE
jgi:hypothetical protein